MNLDYNAGLGRWCLGSCIEVQLLELLSEKGEVRYMVTALEVLLMLKGYNPGGVVPGVLETVLEALCVSTMVTRLGSQRYYRCWHL